MRANPSTCKTAERAWASRARSFSIRAWFRRAGSQPLLHGQGCADASERLRQPLHDDLGLEPDDAVARAGELTIAARITGQRPATLLAIGVHFSRTTLVAS